MISRFLPTVGNLLQKYSQVPFFLFSRQAVKQRNFNREVSKIQNCYSLSDAVKYLSKNPEVNDEEFRELSKRVYNSNSTMRVFENITPFIQRFYKVDIQACNLETLSFLSGIVPTLSLHRKLKYTKIQQIQKRIERALLQQKQIKDYQLLAFIQFETQVSKKKILSNKLWSIYKERLNGMNIKSMDKFFKFMTKIRQPQKIEKQIFSEVVKKIKDSLNQNYSLPNKNLIKIYHYVNRINSNVFYVQNIAQLLEKKIKQRLDDLQISEVIELVKFGNQSQNKFIQIATKKIFDMINQNGQSDIAVDVIFKVLGILQKGLTSRLGEERQKKLVQLILKNLQRSNDVITFIEKKSINNSNVSLIHDKILESEYKTKYMENLRYIEQLVLRNAYRGQDQSNVEDLSQAIKLMKSKLNENKYHTPNLIMIGNIVGKLNNLKILETNNTLNQEYKQLKNMLEQSIKQNIKDLPSFKKFIQNTLNGLDLQPFHRRYHHFYEKLIEESIQKQNINEVFIVYFIKANDFNGLKKILDAAMQKQDVFQMIIEGLIKRVNNNSKQFAEHYEAINYGFKLILKSKKKLNYGVLSSINNYLTNWQTHWMICPNSTHNFLTLAIDFVNYHEQNFLRIDCFADYFINSPNFAIYNSQKYVDLLKAIQNRMINYEESRKQKENQLSTESNEQKSQPLKQYSWTSKYSTIIKQLRDYNIMDGKLVEKLKTSKDPTLVQYAFMVTGQFEKYKFEPDQRNLISLFRFKGSNPQYSELLENKKKQISELIASAKVHNLEAVLFNFEQYYEKNGAIFFSQILNLCGQNMYYSKRRVHALFKKIQQKKFFSQDTNKFLQKLVMHYGRNFQRIPYEFHQHLISQCLHRNMKIENYLTRALKHIDFKFKSRQTMNNKKLIKWLILGLQKGMTLINTQIFKKLQIWEKSYILEFASLQKLNEKQVLKISETLNSDLEFTISTGTFNRFKKINEVFQKHNNKLAENTIQKEAQTQLHQILVDTLNENQIQFEVGEVQEYKYIKIGETYAFILQRLYTGRASQVFQNYFSEALQIGKNDEKGRKVFVILKNQRLRNKNFVNLLTINFPQLKSLQEKLLISLENRKLDSSKTKEQPQTEQKKQN